MDNENPGYKIQDIKARIKSPEIMRLVSYYKYSPSKASIGSLTDSYISDSDIFIYGCIIQDKTVGIIVLRREPTASAEIVGIAVSPENRNLGIGRKMIEYVIKNCGYHTITAETDDDAVGFYRKCGFKIEDLGYKYQDTKRYKCTLERSI